MYGGPGCREIPGRHYLINLQPLPQLLDSESPAFPDPETALADPDGLLAVGGNLAVSTLKTAYSRGIFPWYEQGQPILWWSPSERAVLIPGREHLSRSLAKFLRNSDWQITTDRSFEAVVAACAEPRDRGGGTWITPAMAAAYTALHRAGNAHSLECWQDGQLVGGLYGVQVGALFCGESMFSRATNASKALFVTLSRTLARFDYALIDCQVPNPHLTSLGVRSFSRRRFLAIVADAGAQDIAWPDNKHWQQTFAMLTGSGKELL